MRVRDAFLTLVSSTLSVVALSRHLSFVKFDIVANEYLTCDYVCRQSNLHCMETIMTSFSCQYAASSYCGKSPYMHEMPSTNCTDGGGCFVRCEYDIYEMVNQQNSSCFRHPSCASHNYQVCPCGAKIETDTNDQVVADPVQITGISIFLVSMISVMLVLLYKCCTLHGTTK